METFAFHLMPYKDVESEAWPFAQDEWDPEQGAQYYQEYLGQLEYADELGMDGLGVNEHHFSAYGLQPSPNVTAANLAARTENATIAFHGNLPAIRRNPIRLAEELAMLDNISEGRILCGFPRGIPSEYLAYNIPLEESRPRFEEAWELIIKAWTEDEPFDFNGEFFQYENVYIWPRPYQQPHPPLWMAAESEESIRYTAERQVPMGTLAAFEEEPGENFGRYRELAEEEYGWSPGDEYFTTGAFIYVAETTERAQEVAKEYLETFNRDLFAAVHLGVAARMQGDERYDPEKYDQYVENLHPHGKETIDWRFEDHVDDLDVIVGEPAEVVEELEAFYEAMGGFGTLSTQFGYGGMPDDLARQNMELYVDEVKPEVDKIGDVKP